MTERMERNRTLLHHAETLVARLSGEYRYVASEDTWYVWNGCRWEKTDSAPIYNLYATYVHELERMARLEEREEVRRTLMRQVEKLGNRSLDGPVLDRIKTHPQIRIRVGDFDSDPWLLNTAGGVYDMRDDKVRPHAPEPCMRWLAPSQPAGRPSPQWIEFLRQVTGGDMELIAYLQRAIGYSVTADNSEQCFFVMHGTGLNGKSTFANTLRAVLGDYVMNLDGMSLTKARAAHVRDDLTTLVGARLILVPEFPEKAALDVDMLKKITGGDELTLRPLYGRYFSYCPTGKLWLMTNEKPQTNDGGYAFWRRMRLVPFKVTVPLEHRDHELPQKLLAQRDGILRWVLDGVQEWRHKGLGTCEAVEEATNDYRREEDTVGEFLRECCVMEEGHSEPYGPLYEAYVGFCKMNKRMPLVGKRFGDALTRHGVEAGRTREARVRIGVRLVE